MQEEHVEHANFILEQFAALMQDKYERGQKEHGGKLWEMQPITLLDNALDEAIDQVVYLITLKQQLPDLVEKAWMYDDLRD